MVSDIYRYLPADVVADIKNLKNAADICEVRLRIGFPAVFKTDGEKIVVSDGAVCSKRDIEKSFEAICDYSLHSYEQEIREGFITVPGGHRVGICGTAVLNFEGISTVKDISSLNFRIARQINGCAEIIIHRIFDSGLKSLLIAGAPSSGKTTLLRDICRILAKKYFISVIDERSEIAAVYKGEAQNDTGIMSSIFDAYPKAEGIETAVRVMAPDMIICDEIGGDDVQAIMDSSNTGVKITASVHAGTPYELARRKNIVNLIKADIFDEIAFLSSDRTVFEIINAADFCEQYNL